MMRVPPAVRGPPLEFVRPRLAGGLVPGKRAGIAGPPEAGPGGPLEVFYDNPAAPALIAFHSPASALDNGCQPGARFPCG